ncbi:aminotransferase class I/II-fold pyridoxal phosphate-dependent enzyme [Gorillibacterium massiliense]|uniref:aminotransferase class I/II-fold pyridoxal phosphate-dependent enzyme n=1 Tax=Gorillibacterium massiliense TaxID=1280390 RepID=UPI0005934F72|nr:aminotransferase class I/II-fold pyridoxal phosphate-dependent enzyme [Gorillibacterium massiliense]
MNRHTAPLYDRLVRHVQEDHAGFHVPGHKSGAGLDPRGMAFLQAVMAIDLTEITGLDDLHHPETVILEAQELAADCFGAEETSFLVGGSTSGNMALILATCGRDDILIVQRNSHKSILNAIALAGAKAVFLSPEWDDEAGLAAGVRLEDVRSALERYPGAKAVMLTNPNYYGMADDLSPYADLVHQYGKPLLVDEAHGAHLGFHPNLPPSALSSGADGVVQSTHKMLTAMTMGAMLHMQGPYLNRSAVRRCLSAIQSSSPSYPIMASLDLARLQMHQEGQAFLEKGLDQVNRFRAAVAQMAGFRVLSHSQGSAFDYLDPFKISISEASGKVTGYQLQELLESYGCMVEMADPSYALLHFSIATTETATERLIASLKQIEAELPRFKQENDGFSPNISSILRFDAVSPPVSLPAFAYAASLDVGCQSIPLEDAEGKTAAETIIPYPPGIPVVYAGEQISRDAVAYLSTLSRAGARFQGAADSRLQNVRVTVS